MYFTRTCLHMYVETFIKRPPLHNGHIPLVPWVAAICRFDCIQTITCAGLELSDGHDGKCCCGPLYWLSHPAKNTCLHGQFGLAPFYLGLHALFCCKRISKRIYSHFHPKLWEFWRILNRKNRWTLCRLFLFNVKWQNNKNRRK